MAAAHRDTAALLRKHGYTEIKKVGEGSFGKAILVQAEGNTKLICKMVDISRASKKEQDDAVKEAKVLSSLNHPYIVRYRESFQEAGWFCILMDYCEAGDLTKKIEASKKSRTPISEDQILKWFTQAILSLKYIHDRHILHRDLKPQNFFLSKSGSLKMGDFGIAKVLDCTLAVARTQIGTPYYLSPELCKEQAYTTPSDIWAMGCILFEMCALKVPFDAASIPKLVQAIVNGRIPDVPSQYSPFVRNLVKEMLNRDPKKRPGCDELLQLPEIQAVVRSMVAEAQEKEAASDGQAGAADANSAAPKAAAAAAAPKALEGPYKDNAGSYKKNDLVEFFSNSHKSWLPAVVVNVEADGRIVLDLKPNTWMTKEQQASNVRPRTGGAVGSVPARANASPRRTPSVGSGNPRSASPRGQPARPGSRGASPMNRSPSGQQLSGRGAAGNYRSGELVEFWSNSHNDWLPATVTNIDAAGRILIDLKPNTWLAKDEQAVKIRPRRAGGSVDRPSSANRKPPMVASPQLPRPPMHRNPSWGNGIDSGYRAPSPGGGGRAMTPLRAPSPNGRAMTPNGMAFGQRAPSPSGGRAMTPLGGRAPSPSGRRANSRDPPGMRAASPGGYMNPNRPPRVSASPLRGAGAHISGLT